MIIISCAKILKYNCLDQLKPVKIGCRDNVCWICVKKWCNIGNLVTLHLPLDSSKIELIKKLNKKLAEKEKYTTFATQK